MVKDFLTAMNMLVLVHKIAPDLYKIVMETSKHTSERLGLSSEESTERIDLLIRQTEKFADSMSPLMKATIGTLSKPEGPEA